MALITINGTPPGCGTKCRPCGKDVRELCWVNRMCADGHDDIGRPARQEKERGKKRRNARSSEG